MKRILAMLALSVAVLTISFAPVRERQTCLTDQQLRSLQDAVCYINQTSWYMYHGFVQAECECVDPDFLQELAAMQDSIEASTAAIQWQLGLPQCEK